MDDAELEAAKASVRATAKAQLAAMKPGRRAIEEDVVTAGVQATEAWVNAKTVAVYKAIGTEMTCVGLTNAAWRSGRRTAFPRVEGKELIWHQVTSWTQLRPGAFGVPEPSADLPVLAAAEMDVWFVPGVAFSPAGGRVGQGGGFYDRALPFRRDGVPVVGLAFDSQVLDVVPAGPLDVSMDYVVSPKLLGIDLD